MKRITTYYTHDEVFYIVKFDESESPLSRYGAIKKEYTTKGRLNRILRGFDMYLSDSVASVIDRIEIKYVIADYMAQGFDEYASIILAHTGDLEKALQASEIMKAYNNK